MASASDTSASASPAPGAAPTDTQVAALPPPEFTPPAQPVDTGKGPVLANASGMSLYVFDNDTPQHSNCVDRCATHWPPLVAAANDRAGGEWGIITRDDGSQQWTYKGRPLYSWKADKKAGDTTGDGVNDTWHLAKP